MWRRLLSPEAAFFLIIWLALLFFGRSMLFRDPGTFWHISVGELILDQGRVLHEDPFSFTAGGRPWTAHSWAAECGMAVAYRFAGFDGLLLASATLLAVVYTFLATRLLRAGFHWLPTGLIVAVAILAGSHQFHVRPLLWSLLWFAATIALLVDVEAGRGRLRRLWWLVPMVALWSNLHPGVLAGLGSIGVVVAGWGLLWLLGRDQTPIRNGRDAAALAALLLAAAAATLVSPYGIDLPLAWFRTLAMPLPGLIQEHGRLDLANPLAWSTVLLAIGYLVALIGVRPRWQHVTWLLPLVWFVLACQRVRHAPLFAIVAVLILAEIVPRVRWTPWLKAHELLLPSDRETHPRYDWCRAVVPLLLVVAAVLIQATGATVPLVGRGWARLPESRWPLALRDDLAAIGADTPGGRRIFNDLNFGGFVIFYAPQLKVFVDDRCALYGTEFLQAYDDARRHDPAELDRWQQQYGFHHALVESQSIFDSHLRRSDDWSVVGHTPSATLYRHVGNGPRIEQP